MGRIPKSMVSAQAGFSVGTSITVMVFEGMEPATTYLPSGVTYVLCTAPFTGMLLTFSCAVVSMTSTAPGATLMPT